jgi:hypothetical protein
MLNNPPGQVIKYPMRGIFLANAHVHWNHAQKRLLCTVICVLIVGTGFQLGITFLPHTTDELRWQSAPTNRVSESSIPPGSIRPSGPSVEWYRTWGGFDADSANALWSNGTALFTCGSSIRSGRNAMAMVGWDLAGNMVWNRTHGDTIDNYYGLGIWGNSTSVLGCGSWHPSAALPISLLRGWTHSGATKSAPTISVVPPPPVEYLPVSDWKGMWCNDTTNFLVGSVMNKDTYVASLWLSVVTQTSSWWRRWAGYGSGSSGTAVTTDGTSIYVLGDLPGAGGGLDLLLIKWDMQGNQVWNKTWGGTGDDIPSGIFVDGSDIYTCGSTESFGAIGKDLLLIKWDKQGNKLWNRTWGGASDDSGQSISVEGGAVYVCGSTGSFGAGGNDVALVKWYTNGTLAWNKTWGGTGNDVGSGLWKIGDAIYTSGGTTSFGAGGSDMVLVKWDVSAPAIPPTITHPADNQYTVGQTGNSISWTVTDSSIGTTNYSVYSNGTSITSGSWMSGTPVTWNVDGLAIGEYNYTIIAHDGLGASVQDTVMITVVAPLASLPGYSTLVFMGCLLLAVAALIVRTKHSRLYW